VGGDSVVGFSLTRAERLSIQNITRGSASKMASFRLTWWVMIPPRLCDELHSERRDIYLVVVEAD
jgi:hypothetical protein